MSRSDFPPITVVPLAPSASAEPASAPPPPGRVRRRVDPRATHTFRLFRAALPVSMARRLLFRRAYGRGLPLRRPETFAEKINWRMVYDRRPLLSWACDKEAVKAHVAAVHPDVVIPATLWSGVDVGELAGRELPERWVLKPNHRTGLVYLGRGPTADVTELRRVTRGWLAEEQAGQFGEWAYGGARRLLVVEEWLDDAARRAVRVADPDGPVDTGQADTGRANTGPVDTATAGVGPVDVVPTDYKFFVYDGVVAYVSEFTGRFVDIQERIYTAAWEPTDLRFMSAPGPVHPAPVTLDRMRELAGALGRDFDFVRVDLYDLRGRIAFGELTVYPGSGLFPAARPVDDAALGQCWTLPVLERRGRDTRRTGEPSPAARPAPGR